MYMRTGNIAAAIASYNTALDLKPDRIKTHIALAQAYEAQNDSQMALDIYDAALELSPDNVGLLILKAGVLESREQYKAAADLYEAVLATDGGQEVAINNLAMLLVDHLASEENLQKALALTGDFENSKVPTLLDTRGWIHYNVENYAGALPLLKRAVRYDNTQDVFRYHLGMTYYKLGDKVSAKKELEKALKNGAEFAGAEEASELIRQL